MRFGDLCQTDVAVNLKGSRRFSETNKRFPRQSYLANLLRQWFHFHKFCCE